MRLLFTSRGLKGLHGAYALRLYVPAGWSCEPTRYESVGCDGENFSSLKEYEAKGEVFDAAIRVIRVKPVVRKAFQWCGQK